MREKINLEDLKNMTFEDDGDQPAVTDKSSFRNYSKKTAIIIGYLLGVSRESAVTKLESPTEYDDAVEQIQKDETALAVRHLNNIRSNIMLRFTQVSRTIRVTSEHFRPIDKIEEFEEDFRVLKKLDISIITGRTDLYEYLKIINDEILKRLDKLAHYFPEWVKFRNIRALFVMPKSIEEEVKKFQANRSFYPYQRYMYWKEPKSYGYILNTDSLILEIAYESNGDCFQDYSKVIDASDQTKNNISEFIGSGSKVQIFIDGENADPYKFVSAIYGLTDYEIDKIDKIVVYYDAVHTTRAWQYMKHFLDIPVEAVAVERIAENKSLVDMQLGLGVSDAVRDENADSIILVSSDSDFWSVIKLVKGAKFMVMVESDKCGHNFKNVLRENNVFYCYLDKFKTIEDNRFFKTVFRQELEEVIKEEFPTVSAKRLFKAAVQRSRAGISDAESEVIYNKYIKGLKLTVDSDGNFKIEIPE